MIPPRLFQKGKGTAMKHLGLGLLLLMMPIMMALAAAMQEKVTRFVRYAQGGRVSYGILEGETIRELEGNFLSGGKPTGKTVRLDQVRLLAPVEPSKIIAVGLNYKSHIGERTAPAYPGLFTKFPTTIIGPEDSIVFPPGAADVHYEGELVVVIGKKTHNISEAEAPSHIFGVTAGNDVSERQWQKNDLQWLRAKGSDTFGPLGPAVVQGLNYNDLQLTTRLNGEVRQSQRTNDLLFPVAKIVSYISQFVTLLPGDLVFTGTPGSTRPMKAGDVVEVEIEGIGTLRNKVAG
jgi:2-keto-4-pentenoate hydratase/2-oxohepta-3-ene-1,7-dioic acid hydratase in catechol pathway